MSALKRITYRFICRVIGFRVVVQWDKKTITHYAMNLSEIDEWIDMYPFDVSTAVYAGSKEITNVGHYSQVV